ncbi:cytidine deaminase [Halonotius sp. F2-221B]|uniref:cytidine deaminase n=1 Tax=Halonotius sp. F2-221B TaxID=2731620 RepID=UPI00398A7D5B
MDNPLIEHAREALAEAYVPYSEYRVGAALRTADGEIFTGCNIENANYSNSLHAEEVAIGTAVAAGHREFERLAVSSGVRDGVTPCGMCRQTLAEFCGDDLTIVSDLGDGAVTTYTLGELLPETISASTLSAAAEASDDAEPPHEVGDTDSEEPS